ncbi:MAG TPA: preprotein translocase subunit SecG [Syntrophobacteria bacterium]|nr:preprotein translocase subunit SecG [Syntrophobacteria bacterium]
MQIVLVTVHIVVCVALIVIVLLQKGRGADIGALFGGSSQTLFGSTGGSTFFNRLTTSVAIVFMLTSLTLAYRSQRYGSDSIMRGVQPAATAPAPGTEKAPLPGASAPEPAKAAPAPDKEAAKQ